MMVDENFTHELKYIISTNDNIGDLMDFEQIHLGSVNKSFTLVAGLIHTKDGKTFVNRNKGIDQFYAIFDLA
jgi:hypothetical protein